MCSNNIIPNVSDIVKEFAGVFSAGGEDRATVETDLSAPLAPSGSSAVSTSKGQLSHDATIEQLSRDATIGGGEKPAAVSIPKGQALSNISHSRALANKACPNCKSTTQNLTPDGFKAINSPANNVSLPKAAGNNDLGVSCPSSPLPVGLFLRVPNSHTRVNTGILEAFREYCYVLELKPCTFLHMRNKIDNSTVLYRRTGYSRSRYYQSGRSAIIKEIRRRLRSEPMAGVFFTLTVDTKRFDMVEAWEGMWSEWNRFKKSLNMYRKRHMNAKHTIRYLAALEQHVSGYPHLHVYCPGLRWLIKKQDLGKMDDWWGMGSANTKKERHQDSARGYITKYISKLEGWSEVSMALLWHYQIRLYNMSRCYSKGKQESEWEVLDNFCTLEEVAEGLDIKIKNAESLLEAFSEVGADLVYLKPPEDAPGQV